MLHSMQSPRTSPQLEAAGAGWFLDEVESAAAHAPLADERIAMVERTAAGGEMAPLHRREQKEVYRVLDGELTFFVGRERISAGAGDVVVAPHGAARTFRVVSDSARWLVLTRVASLERFHDFSRAVSQPLQAPAQGWPSVEEKYALAAIGRANGIELLGPPGALPPDHETG
jgi:mannose-6-phosphate isomerase-like protein (cupin superfamily)